MPFSITRAHTTAASARKELSTVEEKPSNKTLQTDKGAELGR